MARVPWQNLYVIEQTDSMTEVPTFSANDVGIEGGINSNFRGILPLSDKPFISHNISVDPVHRSYGTSSYHKEDYYLGTSTPSITLNMPVNSFSLSLFAWLLFQSGCTESLYSANVRQLYCIPYTSLTVDRYASILETLHSNAILGGGGPRDTVSHYLTGSVVRSITLTGEEGGLVTCQAEIMAAAYNTVDDDITPEYDSLLMSTYPPLLFQNLNFYINDSSVRIKSFNINVTNNVTPQFYDSLYPEKFILGNLEVTGNFNIPWSDPNYGQNSALSDFMDMNEATLEFIWGTAGVNLYTRLAFNAIYSGSTLNNDIEVISNIPFVGVTNLTESLPISWTLHYLSSALRRYVAD